jgi:thiosulfate/3-mercaptopyruvate sulfurtransferase
MTPVSTSRRNILAFAAFACLSFLCAPFTAAQSEATSSGPGSAFSIPQDVLIQPETLAHLLQSREAHKPIILQVGSHVLYDESHIAGSLYAGPGSQPTGLQTLHDRLASTPRNEFIVLYCGCCPWSHCPNIAPAFQQVRSMGFTNVKVLYLSNNFGTDWVKKGYPVD